MFIHRIDPIIGDIGGVYLWWYGASYTFGFIGVWLWLRRNRAALMYDQQTVGALLIFLAGGVLLGGRFVEVIFYEWAYYGAHPQHIIFVWLGGMSTHGILLGATLGVWLFCRRHNKPFIPLADSLAIVGAYIMGVGRIGNFIDGQIAGAVTDVYWGVQFPDMAEFRHPVVLYDGIKNLLLIPLLLFIRRYRPPPGVLFGHFILWYGFLRIFVDLFREYRTNLAGFPPGQEFNILMTALGLFILWYAYRRRWHPPPPTPPATNNGMTKWQYGIFLFLLLLPLTIPSDWTQDVPMRYGKRHAGLTHSALYPPLND